MLPASVPDPIEPFNRAMWGFNKGLMKHVIKPTARVYRVVVPLPARTGVDNLSTNLTYPARLLNNMLQGKWTGAGNETARFLANTVFGFGGLFDVATPWGIEKSDADFGQTLGQWGWRPQFFLMLPIYGPSNDRDTVGLAADSAANPLDYLVPYSFDGGNPLTWVAPYTYFSYFAAYNEMSDRVNGFVRASEAEMDAYADLEYIWTFARANRVADFQVKGKPDEASLETLQSVFFTFKDPHFPDHGKTKSALMPATGRKLKFTYWMQKGKAPVVYIIPGLGSHRLAEASVALAELVFNHGFSAVCVSSPFNSEFMENASTSSLPAYLPVDGRDLHRALTAIDAQLSGMYPNRLGERALLGYSMGAFDSLYIAATADTNSLLKFDRYMAINTPVRQLYGVGKLDEFYNAPLAWPASERTEDIENTFLKVAALSKSAFIPRTSLPFDAVESKMLIGVMFRFILRDIIYTSQLRRNQGVLHEPISKSRREPVYREILQYSYDDYFEKFAVPYYESQGLQRPAREIIAQAGDLRTYDAHLRGNTKIRLIANENDFLLAPQDIDWLRATFPPDRLTIFPEGGHLGNLFNPSVQQTIVDDLSGLGASVKP